MARTNTTLIYSTNGNDSQGWYDRRRAHTISGSVTVNTGTCFASLPIGIPARSRVIWARLTNQTTVPVTGGIGTTTTAPTGYALIGIPTTATASVTAPNQTNSVPATNQGMFVTNGGVIQIATNTTSAQTSMGVPACEGRYGTNAYIFQNTNTVPAYMALVPCFTAATSSFAWQANGTNSSGLATAGSFGTSTTLSTATTYTVIYELFCEEFSITT